ncbi:hypothetical protein MPNT_170008 [Candidatus Methylacidithermus pantelleriae]|uniref:Uncharacterized protein n=1 Tax=Candidatus Methylacidithermus pantelleriae TaxID=2744239 RepID=A0A8J2FNR3_9BACT|nr:hypothetical protein MPNT_170008 [Candidatus Methylacidithermus pantelleriae]
MKLGQLALGEYRLEDTHILYSSQYLARAWFRTEIYQEYRKEDNP